MGRKKNEKAIHRTDAEEGGYLGYRRFRRQGAAQRNNQKGALFFDTT
jgi:hypothetical protein